MRVEDWIPFPLRQTTRTKAPIERTRDEIDGLMRFLCPRELHKSVQNIYNHRRRSFTFRPITSSFTAMVQGSDQLLDNDKPKGNTHIERTSTQFRQRVLTTVII